MRTFVLAIALLATTSIARAQAPGQVDPGPPPPTVAAPRAPDAARAPGQVAPQAADPEAPPAPEWAPQPEPPPYETAPQRYEQPRYEPRPYEPPPPPRYDPRYDPRQVYTPVYVQTEQAAEAPPRLPHVFGTAGVIFHSPSSGPNGVLLEGGLRPGETPMWLHGAIETGTYSMGPGGGSMWEIRAGLEWRTCSAFRHACLITGADLGYIEIALPEMDSDTGTALVPRIGLDTGGRVIRFRAELQLPITSGLREYDASYDYYGNSPYVTDGEHTRIGVATSVGIAAQF